MSNTEAYMETLQNDVYKKHNVNVIGSGHRVMVFAHGLGLDQNTWRLIWPAFTDDFKTVLFDYVGCGKSDKSQYNDKKYGSLVGYADDLNNLCQQLNLTEVFFVGHSISSMIGLIAALKMPALYGKFVFIAPSPRYVDDVDGYIGGYQKSDVERIISEIEEDYTAWVRDSIPTIANEANSPELVEEVIKSFMANDKDVLKQFALASFFIDYRKELLKFEKECLILQSSKDVVSQPFVGDYLHAHLKHSKLIRLKGKGHFPHLTSSQEVINAIKSFI